MRVVSAIEKKQGIETTIKDLVKNAENETKADGDDKTAKERKPATDTAHELKTIKAGPMSAGDYKKHTAALAADGIAWEDC